MANSSTVKIIKDASGEERVMIRVDKTLKEMMEEKPSSRWGPDYWNPKYDYLDQIVSKFEMPSLLTIEGPEVIIAGDHVRPSKGESKGYGLGTKIEYYETAGFLDVAYDYSRVKECSENAFARLKDTSVQQFDILISVAGVGGVGKARSCIVTNRPAKRSCTGDVFTIRLKKTNPFYFYVFLKSKIGKDQILRMKNGVGTENLNTKEALELRLPIIPISVQVSIERKYKQLMEAFNTAMKGKIEDQEAQYKKNITKAESMLRDLISSTEAVIRGERDDI